MLLLLKIQRAKRQWRLNSLRFESTFFGTYGKYCQNVDRHCVSSSDSEFLRQLLFFFNAQNS
ncbi:hypothetical protein NC651_024862 [Populus alba x Populus x berolinensis]|nr:hypothetical protein NC651_024862 [Populus alba x Populus x berolinensis]